MQPHSRPSLERILAWMATLAPPRHRDLARAMLAELESIGDAADRRRFAAGAIAAIVRLTLSGFVRSNISRPPRLTSMPEPTMSQLSTRELLRRHIVPFAVAFSLLTALLVGLFAFQTLPRLSARGDSAAVRVEALLLSLPFNIALSIPMAVFIAVAWVFTRLGRERALPSTQGGPSTTLRLLVPIVAAAALIAGLTSISNTQILPRTNGRLTAILSGNPAVSPTDRSMTVRELREAARTVRASGRADAAARAAAFEVEIQKKFALAASCIVLALAGAAIALRFPRGGMRLLAIAGSLVYTGYYISLVAGEALADQLVISPFLGVWLANALLLCAALLLFWRPGRDRGGAGGELLAAAG